MGCLLPQPVLLQACEIRLAFTRPLESVNRKRNPEHHYHNEDTLMSNLYLWLDENDKLRERQQRSVQDLGRTLPPI